MDNAVNFTVSVDDIIDTQRLATRKYAIGAGMLFVLLGLGIAVFHPAGLVVTAIGGLTFLAWRFPVGDRWFEFAAALRLEIGALCEVWLDENGIAYRQAGLSGHINWSAITRILEDDRSWSSCKEGLR